MSLCETEFRLWPGNVLLLRGHITIHSDLSMLSADELVQRVAEHIIATNRIVRGPVRRPSLTTHTFTGFCCPQADDSPRKADLEKNLNDVLHILPNLRVGLDVNVKFQQYNSRLRVPCVAYAVRSC